MYSSLDEYHRLYGTSRVDSFKRQVYRNFGFVDGKRFTHIYNKENK